ncbi:SMC-Scp complex subunit ScpB [Geomicrobium sediminis]|uniref:Segregation and condensation protein B n=1 Tax=Geomicrobium sediminis TaxID=1347788 RepID=A0ABS2PDU9_9BACL|nr:SMC-Scp complex subunit ScpB [Geomicrobium sediminis]MBM7633585.1 segregation and condensation protein B [Geomicrobium sediminis]
MHEELTGIIETLLYVSGDEGIDVARLATVLELEEDKVSRELERLKEEYEEKGYTLQLMKFGSVYTLTTRPKYASYIERYAKPPERSTLSQAALESLAIVAYRQPVTRSDVEEIRGVNADRALSTLVSKGLVEESGRAKGVGRAILYVTTERFLDVFELESLQHLPKIEEDQDQDVEQMDLFLSNYKDLQNDE